MGDIIRPFLIGQNYNPSLYTREPALRVPDNPSFVISFGNDTFPSGKADPPGIFFEIRIKTSTARKFPLRKEVELRHALVK